MREKIQVVSGGARAVDEIALSAAFEEGSIQILSARLGSKVSLAAMANSNDIDATGAMID